MPFVVDFHTHSAYSSDGAIAPADLVGSAKTNNPAITHMALSDHNTYGGCRDFLAACRDHGIEGFVFAEISGTHPGLPGTEFHFLTCLGGTWSDSVAKRARLFIPHFNRLSRVDTKNMFLLLEAAGQLGIHIGWRQVVRQSTEVYRRLPAGQNPDMIPPPGFHHLRRIIRDGGFGEQTVSRQTDLEARVWRQAGVQPLPTPSITDAYPIFRQARPAVILAHPMLYGRTPAELRPYIQEWQREMGLVGLECHYGNVLDGPWKALADELGLLVSAGSDRHAAYVAGDPKASVPVVREDQADIPALLAALRAAG
jgi:hypothetical protein